MAKSIVVVAIPIYKELIDADEIASLKKCIEVLKDYTIIFFSPVGLNTMFYEQTCRGRIPFKIKNFDAAYFTGIEGYNQLMLSSVFYKAFFDYKFILIYQLDAFVFRDELAYWCNRNFDFIGAPHQPHLNRDGESHFLRNFSKVLKRFNGIFSTNRQISNVGNGGFSLRKVRKCYWLVRLFRGSVKKWGNNNEDGFFKYWGNVLHPFFRLPDDGTALKFAIETEPRKSLATLGNRTPFGCHAYKKYDWAAWKPFIESNLNEGN